MILASKPKNVGDPSDPYIYRVDAYVTMYLLTFIFPCNCTSYFIALYYIACIFKEGFSKPAMLKGNPPKTCTNEMTWKSNSF